MLDLLNAKEVELCVDETGKVWVNVDGACAIRVGKAETVVIDNFGKDRRYLVGGKKGTKTVGA